MAANYQLKRTCADCATVWYVSPSDLKGPSIGELFDKGVGFGKVHKRSVAVRGLQRESAKRVADLARCPNCGFAKYSEVRV